MAFVKTYLIGASKKARTTDQSRNEVVANMSTEGSREEGVTEVVEQDEASAGPPPTIYWAYK